MIKVFRDMEHPQTFVAEIPGTGWLRFPARENGWEQRQPARGLDPLHLREVPLSVAAGTGLTPKGHRPLLAKVA